MEKKKPVKKTVAEKKVSVRKPLLLKKTEPEKKAVETAEKIAKAPEKKEKVSHTTSTQRKKRSKVQAKISQKLRPRFKGRFGKPNVRRKSIEKWQKWRKPRGIDMRKGEFKGRIPNSGYQTLREIRGLHPSGFREVLLSSLSELKALQTGIAVRIRAGVGQKKRKQLLAEARQKGIHVLN